MRVVEVIIDVGIVSLGVVEYANFEQGFKSYAVRTVISGW